MSKARTRLPFEYPIEARTVLEAHVRSHAVEPWTQRRAFLRAVAIALGGKQSFLHRVFGARQGTEHAVAVDQQLAAMTLDVAGELVHCALLRHGSFNHLNAKD
jgi:hypothetical protein